MAELSRHQQACPIPIVLICDLLRRSADWELNQRPCVWDNSSVGETSFYYGDPMSRIQDSPYAISDPEQVREFLDAHPRFLRLLLEAPKHIAEFFSDVMLGLEVFHDPEEEMPDTLVVCVWTRLDPPSAVERRARFIDEWLSRYLLDHPDSDIMIALKFQR
jgi:hypothetical protein